MKKTALRRVGRKGAEWQAAWRELKPKLERAGVTRCEFRYEGCWNRNGLTPAHSLKRRNITTPEQLREVAIACFICHAKLELLHEPEMTKAVQQAIAARPDWE